MRPYLKNKTKGWDSQMDTEEWGCTGGVSEHLEPLWDNGGTLTGQRYSKALEKGWAVIVGARDHTRKSKGSKGAHPVLPAAS